MLSVAPVAFADETSPLNGAPQWLVDQLSLFPGSQKRGAGPGYFGVASDMGPPAFSATANSAPWQLIGGSATLVSQAVAAGAWRLGTAATDEAPSVLKLNGGAFLYSTTKPIWFAARIALDNIITGDAIAGLAINTYTAADLAVMPTDGIFFHKTDTGTDFTFQVRNGGTSTATTGLYVAAGTTLVADTMAELAFTVKEGTITAYVNGRVVATVARGNANIPVDAADLLTVYMGRQAEGANVRYMDVDYFLVAGQR